MLYNRNFSREFFCACEQFLSCFASNDVNLLENCFQFHFQAVVVLYLFFFKFLFFTNSFGIKPLEIRSSLSPQPQIRQNQPLWTQTQRPVEKSLTPFVWFVLSNRTFIHGIDHLYYTSYIALINYKTYRHLGINKEFFPKEKY